MAGPVVAGDARPVQHDRDRQAVKRDVHQQLIESTVEERGVERDHRVQATERQTRGAGQRVLLGDADIVGAVGVGLGERRQAGGMEHGRGDRHDVTTLGAEAHQLLAEHVGPAVRLGLLLTGQRVERLRRVEAVLVVVLGGRVTVALGGEDVHDDRPAEIAGLAQRRLDGLLVVAVDRADVLQPEILEHHLRRDDVLDALLETVQGLVQGSADHGHLAEVLLDELKDMLVVLRHAQRRQMGGQAADRRRIGPAVVVDDDDERQVGVLGVPGDVVERLPGHAPGQRTVADHRDDRAAGVAAQLVRLGEPVGVRQGGRGVGVLDDVVVGLGLARVARKAALLAERDEVGRAPGEHLVHVRLVAGVPQDAVSRRVEDPVQRDGQLDDPEVRAEVASDAGGGVDQEVAQLRGQCRELADLQTLEISRTLDGFQQAGPPCARTVGSLAPLAHGIIPSACCRPARVYVPGSPVPAALRPS